MFEFVANLFRRRPNPPPAGESLRTAEAGRRPIEGRFEDLVAGVRDYALFMLDPEGHVATWNAGAERLYGYSPAEVIGQHFSRLYTPEAVERGRPGEMLRRAAADGRFGDEGWRIRTDGSRFWASVVLTAVRSPAGEVTGFLKITRDLTEQKRADESARRLIEEEAARRAAEAAAREADQARQEERRQREQLLVTLRSIGDAVIVTDARGAVTFLNPVAAALTGWSPDAAAGRPLDEVFPIINEVTRRRVESPVAKVLRDGVTVELANHTALVARDGREVPVEDTAAPIRLDGDGVIGTILVFRDVTEARRSAEARARLAAIVESSDDAIIGQDLDGVITSWNRGAERLYGYTAEEVVGRPLTVLIPPDHPDELPAIIARLRRGERVDHFETVRVRKDGTRVDVSLTISPITNAEGEVIGASKIARDVTAQKRTEAGLRFLAEAGKALAALVDVPSTLQKVAGLAVPHFADWCAVDLLDAGGVLRRVAVAHADPAKVALAHDLYRRYPPDPTAPTGTWAVLRAGRSEIVPVITDAMLDEAVPDAEYRRALRHLGLRSYIGVPLVIRGEARGVVAFVAAESGRRYGPDDLRLAEEIAQRAAVALENARLYAELKDADRRKDEFLAMLAHELRNPLAPIRNALHIMRLPGASPPMIEQARRVTERQVEQMVRLIDDLLDVSRIMRGRIELRKQPVDLAAVVAGAVEAAQPALDAQGQELIVDGPREPLHLDADPARLTQVVGNLLQNAAKFSRRAGRVWLTLAREGDEAVLRVRDEGAGIPADLLPRVFDLFVQGESSLARTRGGLGIGLTVVRNLVEMHGGSVAAHSGGAGKGSEFVVRLPGVREGPAPGPADPAAHPGPPPGARRVLVVDDNVDAAESTAILLRLWGHQVRLAHNGPEAVTAAEALRPDVVLLDIGLPGFSGYEVARQLRRRPEFAGVLLVAVTGYGQTDDRRRSAEAGFDRHLTKPIDPVALEQLITEARETASGGR